MKNILWITTQFPSSETDTKGSFIFRTIKELEKHYLITVICLHSIVPPILPMVKNLRNAAKIYKVWRSKYPKIPVSPKELKSNVIYARYFRLPRGLFHYIEGWLGYLAVKKYVKNLEIDFIHSTWLFPEGDLANYIYKKFKIPFIVTLMGSDVHFLQRNTKKWIKARKIIENAKYVTSVSKQLYIALEEKGICIPEAKRALTHTFYEFDKFIILDRSRCRKQLSIDESNKIIFYAGTLREIKNIDILIFAFTELLKRKNKIKLLIAGRGEEEGKLKKMVNKNNLNNKVNFLGGLNGAQMIKYYNAADIFVLPSKNEGLPNVVVESLLCGTPVVATSVGEIPYLIKNGENGFLVNPDNIDDLSYKLSHALNHDWDRKKLRNSIDFLSPQNVMNEYYQVYNSVK